jgi:hypothetical protein
MEKQMTAKELWNAVQEGAESVQLKGDSNRRAVQETFQVGEEFWEIEYEVSFDGMFNSWEEGLAKDPKQIFPHEVTTIQYY